MIGKHHAIVAAASWAAVYGTGIPGSGFVPGLAVATVAGLLPDIDEDGAIVSRALGPVGNVLSDVVSLVAGGHRGATHTLPAVVLVAAAVYWLWGDPALAMAAGCGYLSHLIGDTLTPMGVPWLWPLRSVDHRYSLNLFTTGTFLEVLVTWGWVIGCGVIVYRRITGV